MSHPQVVNVRTAEPGTYVYVGRAVPGRFAGSIYGNPFVVGKHGGRGECVAMFRAWLDGKVYVAGLAEHRARIIANLPALASVLSNGGKLGCWCAPADCHAEVLVELATAPAPAPAASPADEREGR